MAKKPVIRSTQAEIYQVNIGLTEHLFKNPTTGNFSYKTGWNDAQIARSYAPRLTAKHIRNYRMGTDRLFAEERKLLTSRRTKAAEKVTLANGRGPAPGADLETKRLEKRIEALEGAFLWLTTDLNITPDPAFGLGEHLFPPKKSA
jgi:hypothetical protein